MISCIKYNNYVQEKRVYIKMLLMFIGILVEAVSRIGQGKRKQTKSMGSKVTGRWLWRGLDRKGKGKTAIAEEWEE